MALKLMTHHNQYGYGVSVVRFKDNPYTIEAGFVLRHFDDEGMRDAYAAELAKTMSVEVENLN